MMLQFIQTVRQLDFIVATYFKYNQKNKLKLTVIKSNRQFPVRKKGYIDNLI